ncbi:MAG: FecR domain-containing protein [Ignavibacteriaceae bacterium]
MHREIDWALFAKYFAGEITESEKQQVEDWLKSDPLNKDQFESIESTWNATADKAVQWDVDKAWSSLSSKIGLKSGEREKSRESLPLKKVVRKKYYQSTKLLSTVGLLLLFSLVAFLYNDVSNKPARVNVAKKLIAIHEVTTGNGQRANFKLSDGTEVFLNSASSIKFPSKFSGSKRTVYLSGEAFFKVKQNNKSPFKVMIANGEITDIGTEFNVKSWKDDEVSVVSVKEGKVSFANSDSARKNIVFLSENQTAKLSLNGKLSTPVRTNVKKLTSWLIGRLYFENSTLKEVFKSLNRSYNFSCSVQDSSLLSLHLTAVFKENNLKEIAKIISLALDFQYKISDNKCQFSAGKKNVLNKKIQALNL